MSERLIHGVGTKLQVAVLQCPNCGHIELFDRESLDRTVAEIRDANDGVGKSGLDVMDESTLLGLGIRPGGEDLPPEDPEVARMYEEDAIPLYGPTPADEDDKPIG